MVEIAGSHRDWNPMARAEPDLVIPANDPRFTHPDGRKTDLDAGWGA